ncbi:SMI1/KNR4 family protein [Leptospira adleri]|uniref:SMI1/KNR4 family protein n=1 Tax=Leptospira adleri TaxID=2023186 RepID=UPI0010827D45|nr:SMI1/KNR4 family protein [Leptospira adleri]TGM52879.1 SMI1/KNR4 family protein [Leptospira adleri]
MDPISKLIKISGNNIGDVLKGEKIQKLIPSVKSTPYVPKEILNILRMKNGFFAFESALHLFHLNDPFIADYNILWWNLPNTWKIKYQNNQIQNSFCFAQDTFGNQFCTLDEAVYLFDAETAEFEFIADSIENWTNVILDDYEYLTGHTLIHEWQQNNGEIPLGYRLVPKTPFCLGGDYSVANLQAVESVKAMCWRAGIYNQIKNLPEGSKITFSVID